VRYLRTVSTQRLLALIAALLVAIVGGTAIAVAAAGNGPVPPREPLGLAVHQALAAPAVTAITARISFTNGLIGSSEIEGPSDPLLQGGSGRLWLSSTPGDHRLRIELQSDDGDAQLVFDNGSFSIYDPTSNTAYEGSLPRHLAGAGSASAKHVARSSAIPSIAQIERALNRLAKHVGLSGAIPSDVAGQAAYTVRVSPLQAGGLIGAAELAWDAARGVPLRIAIYARGNSSPVLALQATDISYGPVSASDFAVSPPPDAKLVRISTPNATAADGRSRGRERSAGGRGRHARIERATGVSAVAGQLGFALDAPSTLAGMSRGSVSLLGRGAHAGALIFYGHGLGGIAVLEQPTRGVQSGSGAGNGAGPQGGLSLPTVAVNGATGQELDTALGTMVRFTRGQVGYTVIGSVLPAVADAAARGL
jgi:hypothetical protein